MHGIGLRQAVQSLAIAAGAEVDTANYEGVCFFSTTGGTLQGLQGDLANGSDQENAGAAVTIDAGKALEIHKPRKRYVSCTGGGALIAVLYGARSVPAMTGASVTHVSPE